MAQFKISSTVFNSQFFVSFSRVSLPLSLTFRADIVIISFLILHYSISWIPISEFLKNQKNSK